MFTDPGTAPVIHGVDVMNSTLVKVTWSSIPKETVHGLLRGYQVGIRLIFLSNFSFHFHFLNDTVEFVSFLRFLTDFKRATEYLLLWLLC